VNRGGSDSVNKTFYGTNKIVHTKYSDWFGTGIGKCGAENRAMGKNHESIFAVKERKSDNFQYSINCKQNTMRKKKEFNVLPLMDCEECSKEIPLIRTQSIFWHHLVLLKKWVMFTCNPSYSGGRDQEDSGLKPA
jgi:hypothetical protein